jgi:hypothetical protein
MYLKDLIEFLSKMPSDAVARPAFDEPMSHRGNYCDLAFDPIEQSTAGEMLKHATAALGATFTGYKGGDYTMTEWTDCYLASYGCCGDALTEATLDAMFKVPALEAKLSASEREVERLRAAYSDKVLEALKLRAVLAEARNMLTIGDPKCDRAARAIAAALRGEEASRG